MSVEQINFNVDQGSDFSVEISLLDPNDEPIDISNAQIIGQVRKTASSKTIEAVFTIVPIDLTIGQFTLILTAEESSKMKCMPSYFAQRSIAQFAYDVEVHFNNGKVTRILQGVLNVSPEVTR